MCGIFASVSAASFVLPSKNLQACLCRRGPDHSGLLQSSRHEADDPSVSLSFFSTVLSLRGGHVTAQPLSEPDSQSVLCWNGEAWKIAGQDVEGNDGEVILSLLSAAARTSSLVLSIDKVLDVLRSIAGPFAFVFFDKSHDLIFFGRDCLGRRSLLHKSDDITQTLQFSSLSVAPHVGWFEVEADGIYILDLGAQSIPQTLTRSVPHIGKIFRAQWAKDGDLSTDVSIKYHLNHVCLLMITGLGTRKDECYVAF